MRTALLRVCLAGSFLIACEESEPATPPDAPETAVEVAVEAGPLAGEFAVLEDVTDAEIDLDGVIPTLSDFPIPLTKRTLRYVEQFSKTDKGRESFATRYRRSKRFEPALLRPIQELRMPEDLAYVVAIESGFNPQATSPKGAGGLWQMMPPTAERFGLTITPEVDERRSIPQSTDAALQYFGFLFERFLSWDLALAAYNCGEGCVDQAIERGRVVLQRGEGAYVTFPELASHELLPEETREFVARVHAFAIVAHNRAVLGFEESEASFGAPLEFAEIAVPPATRLSTVARVGGLSLAELQELNPQFLTDRAPAASSDVLVYVPPERLSQILAALPSALSEDEAAPQLAAKSSPKSSVAAKPSANGTKASKPTNTTSDPQNAKAVATKGASFQLVAAPFKPGAFVLSSGALVSFEDGEQSERTARAEIRVRNPLQNRTEIGSPLSVSTTKLDGAFTDVVRSKVEGEGKELLRTELTKRRKKLYEKTSHAAAFDALSAWAFPSGHPDAGLLVVGPTDPADDMFLEPEPTWSFEVLVTVGGKNAKEEAPRVDELMASVFMPKKPAPLPRAKTIAEGEASTVLLAFASTPVREGRDELTKQLAFEVVCHNKLGRLHNVLRREKKLTTDVLCAMETTPHATLSWVLVSPQSPHTVAAVETAIDDVLAKLLDGGVTDTELASARGLVRAEAAREVQTATLRGHPKSRVEARNKVLLSSIDDTKASELKGALDTMFSSTRRFAWRGAR